MDTAKVEKKLLSRNKTLLDMMEMILSGKHSIESLAFNLDVSDDLVRSVNEFINGGYDVMSLIKSNSSIKRDKHGSVIADGDTFLKPKVMHPAVAAFIGTKFRSSSGSVLTVGEPTGEYQVKRSINDLGRVRRPRHPYFNLHCSVCSNMGGVFKVTRCDIKKGHSPCGCNGLIIKI